MENIVRLESLRFQNLKNVINGELYFGEKKKIERGEFCDDEKSYSVLGIYGQNGSGKTTALNALRIIQGLFSGVFINPIVSGYINVDKEELFVGADFYIKTGNGNYFVYYDVSICKTKTNSLFISNEKISYFKVGEKDRKVNAFEFSAPDQLKPSFIEKLNQKDRVIYQYTASIETSFDNNNGAAMSSIFNKKLLSIISGNKENMSDFYEIVSSLSNFAINNLAIYSINYFNENENVGIRFRVKNGNDGINFSGDIFVPFTPFGLDTNSYVTFKKIIGKINKVMPSIIPGYSIEINETNNPQVQRIINRVEFVMTSRRGSGKPIPLLYESNGIKKIISILSGLIDAYSNEGCLMAIDEIDSGIFEYLLGEIVYAFDNFGRGQLIFTSHNMRVLEKVNYKNIFFTTTNHDNAFVQLTNIRDSNNLRDMYYKYIANGYDEKTKLYDMVRTEDLVSALYVERK